MQLDELYRVGQYIQAIFNMVDQSTGEMTIFLIDPWDHIKYLRGDIVTGTVVRLGLGNIFVALSPGVIGITAYPASTPTSQIGEKMVCKVDNFNPKKKKSAYLYLIWN